MSNVGNTDLQKKADQTVELALKDVHRAVSVIKEESKVVKRVHKDPFYFPHRPVGQTAAIVNTVFGSLLTLGFGIPVFVLSLIGGDGTVIFGLSIPLLAGLMMDVSAGFLFRRVRRYRRYMNLFKGRNFCFIDEVAEFCGLNEKFVLNDLQKMLGRGTFPHSFIAEEDSIILLTRDGYNHYILEQRKRKMFEEELRQNKQDTPAALETNETVKEGREFIRKVNTANRNIRDYEVSDKIVWLEDIITRIVNHIEKHPEQIGNVRRFIQFYLPLTIKLLNAYAEFEKQPIEGENIRTAKQEIKDSLDKINQAFENLFNNLFAGIYLDISTDISVLHTMLEEEGLTDPFASD